MAPQPLAAGKGSKSQSSSASLTQAIPSPSTEMDTAIRRTHPKHFINAALEYLPASVKGASSAPQDETRTFNTRNTRFAALFAGLACLGIGRHLTNGGSLVGLAAGVLAFTMIVAFIYQLLGGGNIGHRSFREQGHFICESVAADVICDTIDGLSYLWNKKCRSTKLRVAFVGAVVIATEAFGGSLTVGRVFLGVGASLVALAGGKRKR